MDDEDALLLAGASLAALRRHLGADDRSQSRVDLFLALRRQWDVVDGAERAGSFLRAVAACELHDQLLSYVLQLHARDALDIVEQLAVSAVIERECFAREEFEAAAPAVETLVAAALTITLTLGSQADDKDRLRDELERRVLATVEGVGQRDSALCGALTLLKRGKGSRETESWKAFEALPFELDSQLGSTRSGRSRIQTMTGVLCQQQQELQVFLSACNPEGTTRDASEEVRGEERLVADRFWEIARNLLVWIEERRVAADELVSNSTGATVEESDTSEESDQAIDALLSEADLETYLISSSISPRRETSISVVSPEPASCLDIQSSRIRDLLEAFSRHDGSCNTLVTGGLLAAAYDELTAVREVRTLQVQVSYLLACQLEARRAFVEIDPLKAQGFERQVQRELNSLTENGARMESHLRSLLTLAAFCPKRLVELVVHGAQANNMHHSFYLKLLAACPLLVTWEEQQSRELSVFKSELQRMVEEVTSQSGQFEDRSRHMVAFLSGLIGISEHPQVKPIIPLPELLRDILLPLLVRREDSITGLSCDPKLFNTFNLHQQLCSRIIIFGSSNLLSMGSSGLELFKRSTEAYASLSGVNTREGLRFREVLLLLTKDVLELFVTDVALSPEVLASALLPTLTGKLLSDPAFTALVAPVIPSILSAFVRIPCKRSGEGELSGVDTLTLDQVKTSTETALWGLLWASLTSNTLASYAPVQVPELWRCLDNLATWTDIQIDGFPASQGRVSGASVIQSAAASILLSCGESLSHSFRDNLVPYLMECETVDLAKRGAETLTLPFTRDKSDHSVTNELMCSLVSPHYVARYLIKCWSLMALKLHRENSDLLFGMLRGVIGACDSAVNASTTSPTQLLACLQWECYLAFSAHELKLNAKSWWPVLSAQLEMSLLRILHDLARIRSLSQEQASATGHFAAAWLSLLPPDSSFAAVFRYLKANQGKTR